VESDEDFWVEIGNPVNATIDQTIVSNWRAVGTIMNDDVALPVLQISSLAAVDEEGDSGTTPFTFQVIRSGDTSGSSTFDWIVEDIDTDGNDFVQAVYSEGTASFAAGETEKVITIEIAGDTDVESDEDFWVEIGNPVNATIDQTIVSNWRAVGTIMNDDYSQYSLTLGCDDSCELYINGEFIENAVYPIGIVDMDINDILLPGSNEIGITGYDNSAGSCWAINLKIMKDGEQVDGLLESYCDSGCSPCGNPVYTGSLIVNKE
ncbi:MAG TPA: Calx-beta domain-containing protein, partial [Desulfuromonadales bacterium]|nr:Calx-beta domain-containing protein [Desulfuromonadales bacterium]